MNEDTSSGWSSDSTTWVAVCRNRRFICSENTVVVHGSKGPSGVSQGLACREELGSEDTVAENSSAQKRTGAKAPEAVKPSADAPAVVAGFEFGATPADIRSACEAAGETWTKLAPKVGSCSGPAQDIGFQAEVRIDFCRNRSCTVTLVHQPTKDWITTFGSLKSTLSGKYGPPTASDTPAVPGGCREEGELMKCMEQQVVRFDYRWRWPSHEEIELTMGRVDDSDEPVSIRIRYLNPKAAVRANASAL